MQSFFQRALRRSFIIPEIRACLPREFRATGRARWYSGMRKAGPTPSKSTVLVVLFSTSALVAVTFTGPVSQLEVSHLSDNNADTESNVEIRLDEVRKHGRDAERIWITYGTRVYDITDWISAHPGGEIILSAAGGAIDEYWNIFSMHKKQEIFDILETYYIGEVDSADLEDGKIPVQDVDNPFKTDPERNAQLRILTERPFNAEPPSEGLSTFITPNELFYVRNHMWVPKLTETEHKVVVELYDGEQKEFSVSDLKKLEQTKITATLQCSGNRRQHMSQEHAKASGLPWTVGGISTAEFTGVRLRDMLKQAGLSVDDCPSEIKHVHFMGAEGYGASIPIDKAVEKRGDVILAFEMNGKTLPTDHGYPIRVVVPGTVAARSVKWVNKIVLSDEEAATQWQRRDYKCFGPNEGPNPNWDAARSIQETPVQSAITQIKEVPPTVAAQPEQKDDKSIVVEGYAISGGGREIVRVDVSADNGQTWHQAELQPAEGAGAKAWAWKRWRWTLPQKDAGECFVVKATDEAYNSQPDSYGPIYNCKGNLTTAWHRVPYREHE